VGAAGHRQVRGTLLQAGDHGLDVARLKARTTRLGTFEGGFQKFADMFAERLREMGVEIGCRRRSRSSSAQQARAAVTGPQ